MSAKTIGYCRVSTTEQDLDIQKQMIFDYCQKNQMLIHEFIECEVSSRKSPNERKIDELRSKLVKGDFLIVVELSRLGRNMLETLNIINDLTKSEIKIIFIRQPELSTNAVHSQLLLAIYSYFAECERTYISLRTKSGLATAKAKGKSLGRPKGSKNAAGSELDQYRKEIKKHLKMQIPINSILKIINSKRENEKKLSYSAIRYFIEHDTELFILQ